MMIARTGPWARIVAAFRERTLMRRAVVTLVFATVAYSVPLPVLAGSVSYPDPSQLLGPGPGVPLPTTFTSVGGVFYTNVANAVTNRAGASLQLGLAAAAGTLHLDGCSLSSTEAGGPLVIQDPVAQKYVNAGAVNYVSYSGLMAIAAPCALESFNIPQAVVRVTVHWTTDSRFGGNTAWGWVNLADDPSNPTPSIVSGPGQTVTPKRAFFLLSANAAYIPAVAGSINTSLGTGLVSTANPNDCSDPTGTTCTLQELSSVPSVTQYLTAPLSQPVVTEDAASNPASDPCANQACSHEVAFYHGPTDGNVRNGSKVVPTRFLDFHFGSDPLIAQDEMTYDGVHCKGGDPNVGGSGCYPLGDLAAASTSMSYPEDKGTYVKDFNIASWLPPQNFGPDATSNGTATVETLEYDFQWDPSVMQAVTELPTDDQCAQKTTSAFSVSADFGLALGPFSVGAHYTPSGNDQKCFLPDHSHGEDYWYMQPDAYSVNVSGSSHAVGVQVGLAQLANNTLPHATISRAWSAIGYSTIECSDGTAWPCQGNTYAHPQEWYVTSNPSGLTKTAAGQQGDTTTGDFTLDAFNWNFKDWGGNTISGGTAPNGMHQDWIAGEASPQGACDSGLVYLDDSCTPQTVLGTGADAEFFLGYEGEQRPGTAHTVTVNVFDLANNLPGDRQSAGAVPDQTLVAGGPGSALAGITHGNTFFWFDVNQLTDVSAHEIRIFDHPDRETDSVAQAGVQPSTVPIATFDFQVEPCTVWPNSPGFFTCPHDQ